MDRTLDPVYELARTRLEAILDPQGFRLASEYHMPEAFGSAETEYRRRGLRVRLTWDGKDRWLWLQVAPTAEKNVHPLPGMWRDLEAAIDVTPTGAYLREDAVVEHRIQELEHALRSYLAAGERRR